MKAALPVLALAALAACAPAAKAPPQVRVVAPAPRPAATSAPSQRPAPLPAPADTHWMDAPLTAGGWRYEQLERSTTADFLSPEKDRRLASIICLSGGQVRLDVRTAGAGSLTIRTETATRTQMAELKGGHLIILLPPTDPLLDAMALSKGRLALEVEGEAPLYLPSYAEVSRVIEDCRE